MQSEGSPLRVVEALRPIYALAGPTAPSPTNIQQVEQVLRRTVELNAQLLTFYCEMARGMDEFRRAYGLLPAEGAETPPTPQESALQLISEPSDPEMLKKLERGMQDLKVHHASLLEGYHEATFQGSRQLLKNLDPEEIRRELQGVRVKVGPFKLSGGWRPLQIQAIWEEFLHRFRRLWGLESSDYERFFREGFREGYRKFQDTRLRRAAVAGPDAGSPES